MTTKEVETETPPTPAEIRDWIEKLQSKGQGTTGMLDRVLDGYEKLWAVMRAAWPAVEAYPEGTEVKDGRGGWVDGSGAYIVAFEEFERLDPLCGALKPFEGLEPEQMELDTK